jgi:phenylpyruvate tautomerase PptA (4-oxalocrotonate tautomerase family)
MPFVEIHDVGASATQRMETARAVTAAVVESYGVSPATVDVAFHGHATGAYARAGEMPAAPDVRRTFVALHAFARPLEQRRKLARDLTAAVAGGLGVNEASVVIYFLERRRDEAAHGGILASDEDGA